MDQQYNKLGEILKEQGLITSPQLDQALIVQEKTGAPLGKILTRDGLITEEALARALAFQKKLDLVDLYDVEINLRAAAVIKENMARRNKLIPIDFKNGKLIVAMANPLDVQAIDSVQLATGHKIIPVVATESAINEAIKTYMSGPAQINETVEKVKLTKEFLEPENEAELIVDEDAPVVQLANTILTQAFRQRASDVHIEPELEEVRVRYRVDGVLRETMTLPVRLKSLLVSRYKIVSGMDITERRRPQDGRMTMLIDGQELQLRVASLPGVHGENIIIRLLNGSRSLIKLEELGMEEAFLASYRQAFSRSHGAVLNTGPTGSGKTTSLYAMINEIKGPEKKIITIEDPIEYSIDGITQIQINRKAGVDFATGLRSIVRADPDVVMIGEIRDLETAHIAIRAALTGHLVLSSLHTNDASSALTRLIDMGLDPFLVASSVRCVLAQRLARVLCPHCKHEVAYSKERLSALNINPEVASVFFGPVGCRKCQKTGFMGRLGIFELLLMTEEINKLCVNGASSLEIKKSAVDQGMRTLYQDGVEKARRGLISLEEVMRVVL